MDGPGASGKTTVGQLIARRLGYRFIDTGTMYRAVTLLAMERGIATGDEAGLSSLAASMDLQLRTGPGGEPTLVVNGRDVTSLIQSAEIDRVVSEVSRVAGVRHALVEVQRRVAAEGNVVMVGRDIGTVVLPEALVKIFLEASTEVRARRRYLQRQAASPAISYDMVLEDLERRDRLDSERDISPMVAAGDARAVDTNERSADEVVEAICKLLPDA